MTLIIGYTDINNLSSFYLNFKNCIKGSLTNLIVFIDCRYLPGNMPGIFLQ